jgi:hypothetical protein
MTNTDNVKAWIKALRSGEYEQTTSALSQDGKYCCLGVACEVAIKSGLTIDVMLDIDGCKIYDGQGLSLPGSVIEWLGYYRPEPKLGGLVVTALNDHQGWTFNKIADHIEKHMDEDKPFGFGDMED